MDGKRLTGEREKATRHPIRRALLDRLGGQERTLPELAEALPDAAANVVPETSPQAVLAYHLRVLHGARLVAFAGGLYRVVA